MTTAMTLSEIDSLVASYKPALEGKLASEMAIQSATLRLETLKSRIISQAYDDGLIKGKNAEARQYETEIILADNQTYQSLLGALLDVQMAANQAAVEFKTQELLVSLTRAWLYSQRPELP